MTIKIFTKDENTVIQAEAVKDDGTAYTGVGEISLIRILRTGPKNDDTTYPAVTASFTSGNTFEGIISGTIPTEGYWGFQFEYTLVSNGLPVHTRIFYEYVGPTLVPA